MPPTLTRARAVGGTVVYEATAGAGGVSEFDTGVTDLSSYATVELRFRGRTDNNDIYDEALLQFNGDTTVANYHHAAQGANPVSAGANPGGFFAARWNGTGYFNGSSTGAVTDAGILMGYATGATAQANFASNVRAFLYDPGVAQLPQTLDAYTRYIEAATQAHAAADNGPEIITLAGFWTPAAATAITRLRLYPGIGTEFNESSEFKVIGYPT